VEKEGKNCCLLSKRKKKEKNCCLLSKLKKKGKTAVCFQLSNCLLSTTVTAAQYDKILQHLGWIQ